MADTKTLPQPTWPAGFQGQVGADAYTADQMRAYAAAALAAQAQGEPWGWAIVDKDGNERDTRAAQVDFFGTRKNPPYDPEALAREDREWPGLAPHRIVTLYTAPQPAAQPVRKPLTDEQIDEVTDQAHRSLRRACSGAQGQQITIWHGIEAHVVRCTERAHGIGQEGG